MRRHLALQCLRVVWSSMMALRCFVCMLRTKCRRYRPAAWLSSMAMQTTGFMPGRLLCPLAELFSHALLQECPPSGVPASSDVLGSCNIVEQHDQGEMPLHLADIAARISHVPRLNMSRCLGDLMGHQVGRLFSQSLCQFV